MIKRMFVSLTLLALAAFAMAGAATAYFSSQTEANVAISTGTADLTVEADVDCAGTYSDVSGSTNLSWSSIVPGETTEDCFRVTNDGDGTLDVSLAFSDTSSADTLQQALDFRIPSVQGWAPPYSSAYTGAGVALGTLDEGDQLTFSVQARFEDDGDQNDLQDTSTDFTATIAGTTN